MTPPRRITAARIVELERQVSARDFLVLATMRRLRVATARQVERLYSDATPLSNARMARRALRRLVDLRVLARLDRLPGGVQGGAPGHVFSLDVAGLRLSERREDGQSAARRPWPVSRQFLDHALAVGEWYVRLTEAERRGELELLDYVTEPATWRRFTSSYGGTSILKPDAFVRLGKGAWEEYLFLEIDRNTERAPALRSQLELYVGARFDDRKLPVMPRYYVGWPHLLPEPVGPKRPLRLQPGNVISKTWPRTEIGRAYVVAWHWSEDLAHTPPGMITGPAG